jgi:hypothetical protein
LIAKTGARAQGKSKDSCSEKNRTRKNAKEGFSEKKPADEHADIKGMSLEELAAAINAGHIGVEGEIHTARQHALAALTGALRTGAYLREVHRRFGLHGWVPWTQQHCPVLPIKSAYRYKKLAEKFPHVRNPAEIVNLRQAYIEVGILPEKTAKENHKKVPDLESVPPAGTDFRARVRSMREFCRAGFDALDVTTLDETERAGLEAELQALRTVLDTALRRLQGLGASGSMIGKAVS